MVLCPVNILGVAVAAYCVYLPRSHSINMLAVTVAPNYCVYLFCPVDSGGLLSSLVDSYRHHSDTIICSSYLMPAAPDVPTALDDAYGDHRTMSRWKTLK